MTPNSNNNQLNGIKKIQKVETFLQKNGEDIIHIYIKEVFSKCHLFKQFI